MAVPAQAISSLPSTSSLAPVPFDYDVFLSFRGEDTRKNFTDHLYTRLDLAGINTFKDDEKLDKGEEISRSLPEAIEKSRISIIVFSKNYASSSWCLRELVKILECRREPIAQTVLPIFLEGADPSDIRNQAGSFGEALCRHEEKFESEVVGSWRAALKVAGGLIGWDQKNVADGHESKLIGEVVRSVLSILKHIPIPSDVKYPIGINSRVKDMMGFFSDESKNVMIIGIWGMGGIGKTTIAKAVYHQIIHIFEGNSFLEGIREASKKNKGLVKLQCQLLFDILKEKFPISNVTDGKTLIKRRVCAKRVLVVLDDVDDNKQIEALAGGIDWFGSGSKVIITTRNEHVLNRQKECVIYKPQVLDTHQSLQLLCYHAFERDQPPNGFLDIAKSITHETGGLPLALEVLGGYLSDKEKPEWKSTMEKLKKIPNEKIQEKLKISYDGLDYLEKEIFLDIACFFIGTDRKYVNYILEDQLNSIIGIKVLIQKSLLKISYDNKLIMHDLLRDMGREIVRIENPDKPWKRSRVWSHEEALQVLKKSKGTNNIKGLFLNFDQGKEIALEERHICAKAFKGLDNLRLLHLDDAHLVGDFNDHFTQLRWLRWRCPSELLTTNIYPQKLIVLDLSHSKIRLWNMCHQNKFADLKVLNLSHCRFLTRTPHFSGFPNLETLNLEYCVELLEVDESIENLKKLVDLDMRNCIKVVELPSSICKLGSLQNLRLSHCSKLTKLPEQLDSVVSLIDPASDTTIKKIPNTIELIELEACPLIRKIPWWISSARNLTHLLLDETSITELPDAIGLLGNLVKLSVSGCEKLVKLPYSMGKMKSLEFLNMESTGIVKLPDDFGQLSNLDLLVMDDCYELESLPDTFGNLGRLMTLSMYDTGIHKLPENFGELSNLIVLKMSPCQKVESLPKNVGNLAHLGALYASNVSKDGIAGDIGKLSSLVSWCLRDYNFSSLPTTIRDLSKLQELSLMNCTKLQVLPELPSSLNEVIVSNSIFLERLPNMSNLNNLTSLTLANCIKLKVLPELPSSLYDVDASNCISLERLPTMSNLNDLTSLTLTNCTKLKVLPELPSSLYDVDASNCISLERLPTMSNLNGLTSLTLTNCTKLKVLPELPSSLVHLDVRNCISLERLPTMSNFNNFRSLTLTNCTKLKVLPKLLSSLVNLDAQNCISPDVSHLRNIERLFFTNCMKFQSLLERVWDLALSNATNRMWNPVLVLQRLFPHLQCLCFSGSNIHDWFIALQLNQCPRYYYTGSETKVSTDSSIEVFLDSEFEITGLIVCVVLASNGVGEDPTIDIWTYVKFVRNNTIIPFSRFRSYGDPIPISQQDHDQTCLWFLSHESCRLLRNGDQIQVSITHSTKLDIKKGGIHFLYKWNEYASTQSTFTSWGGFDCDGMSTNKELLDINAIDFSGSGLGEVDWLYQDGSKANGADKDEVDPSITLPIPHSLNASSSNICFDADDYRDIRPPNPKKPKKNPPLDLDEEPDVEFSLNLNHLNRSSGDKGKGFISDG